MGVTTPTSRPGISAGDLATGKTIVFQEWRDVVRTLHLLFARMGLRLPGPVWDPAWETSDDENWVQSSSQFRRSLATWEPTGRLTREAAEGALLEPEILFVMVAHAEQLDLRWTTYRVNTDGTRDQIRQDTPGVTTAAWVVQLATEVLSDTKDNGSSSNSVVPFQWTLEGQAKSGETGKIRQTLVRAKILDSSEIPTG